MPNPVPVLEIEMHMVGPCSEEALTEKTVMWADKFYIML